MKKIEGEELIIKAVVLLKKYRKISASLLQRKLSISYYKGNRLLHKLHTEGFGEFERTNAGLLLIYKK